MDTYGEAGREAWVARENRAKYLALQLRAKRLAIEVMDLADALPSGASGRNMANQLVRCATSVAANYRAARRARSKAEWIAKLGIVEEEADEVAFWLDLCAAKGLASEERCRPLEKEALEILAIIVASIKTSKENLRKK